MKQTVRSGEKYYFGTVKKKLVLILPQYTHNPKGWNKQQRSKSQVIQSDSSNCNFREAAIAPEIGLFHGIRLFYPRNPESYAPFLLSGRPILCELDCYVVRMTKADIYIPKEYFCFYGWNCFKHFLFTNITRIRFFSVKWKPKDRHVYLIDFLEESYLKEKLY